MHSAGECDKRGLEKSGFTYTQPGKFKKLRRRVNDMEPLWAQLKAQSSAVQRCTALSENEERCIFNFSGSSTHA